MLTGFAVQNFKNLARIPEAGEGLLAIDQALLPALLSRIACEKAQFTWPVRGEDVAEVLPIRKTGHGGVLAKVRALVKFLARAPLGYDLLVIVLDRRTRRVQEQIRRLSKGHERFVLGIAIEEIEAWWLGDRTSTLAWTGFTRADLPDCRYRQSDTRGQLTYAAEKDDQPKRTLHELTELSEALDSVYGDGNAELARQFAADYWQEGARLEEIRTQCPEGFGAFLQEMTNAFSSVKARSGRLF
jgi:hypothetical protein